MPTNTRPIGQILILALALSPLACSSNVAPDADFRTATNLGNPSLGRNLATGDIDGDGLQDFVLGVPGAGSCDEGEIQVWYAYDGEKSPDESWDRDSMDIAGAPDCDAAFGGSVALGDFNGDGYDDLAVGVPGDEITSNANAGSIQIIYGSSTGLTSSGSTIFSQDTGGIDDSAETGDAYGTAMVSGDLNCDGYADLAVGIPGEAIASITNAGAISVIYGTSGGLSDSGDQFLHQNSAGIEDDAEQDDHSARFSTLITSTKTL